MVMIDEGKTYPKYADSMEYQHKNRYYDGSRKVNCRMIEAGMSKKGTFL